MFVAIRDSMRFLFIVNFSDIYLKDRGLKNIIAGFHVFVHNSLPSQYRRSTKQDKGKTRRLRIEANEDSQAIGLVALHC